MTKPRLVGARPLGTRLFAWAILLAGLLTFAIVVWARTRGQGPTALESLIAEGAPVDHVHAVVPGAATEMYVGTHLGLLRGTPDGGWARVAGVMGDVQALASDGGDRPLLVIDGTGLVRLSGNEVEPLRLGPVQALAADMPTGRVVIYRKDVGLEESRDDGLTWTQLPAPGTLVPTALAIDPQDSQTLVVGGQQGELAVSRDGGQNWTYPANLNGSVTSLAFASNRPGRIWAAAGGMLMLSTDLGTSWEPVGLKQKDRERPIIIGVAPAGNGVTAISADGFMATISK